MMQETEVPAKRAHRLELLLGELERQHADLLGGVRGLETMLESSRPSHGDLTRRLTALADVVEAHASAEEVGDLYLWLGKEFPALRGELRELKAQHAPLVATLRALAEDAPRADELTLNSDLSVGIREAVADIRTHEARESRVIQRTASGQERPHGWAALRELSSPLGEDDPSNASAGPYLLVRRLVIAVIGISLLAIGLAMVVLPGPAIVVIPAALTVLALEFEWARRLLRRVRSQLAAASGGSE